MEDKRRALEEEMAGVGVDPKLAQIFEELAYTADQTGIFPFRLNVRDAEDVIKLVTLAMQFALEGKNVPERLRM